MKTVLSCVSGAVLSLFIALPALASDLRISGTYMVPTSDTDLLPYSQFEIPRIRIDRDGDNISLKYDFPQALTGNPVQVELEGSVQSDNSWVFNGYVGTLNCPLIDGFRNCVARYPGMPIDKSVRDTYLESISKTPEELSARIRIADIFNGGTDSIARVMRIGMDGERIGVLRFKAE